jgi:hypothetical protein
MKAETLPRDEESASESTRMVWLSVTGVSAEATTHLLLVSVPALITSLVKDLPASTELQYAGIYALGSYANTQIVEVSVSTA